ncbi:hypothetical protein M4I21_17575 [Cellulophaga sp. 20_2_10]|uniref:hypothetical protein n=1 Tax=Cellulophaga sp. 20_2_10 TaxID=2942476 RepID=UPI00201AA9A0|nr:hypothetical protein [Cellulophaga sp. 20_2_10]MCL5247632.1 hypothetical protein [Cellulophaga sp. 20_2_10]
MKNILKSILIILIIGLFSCSDVKKENEELIQEIEEFKSLNNRYPNNLNEINESDDTYCYYVTDNSFNLEYISFKDLYWYNSGNDVWDFLEGDADKFHCK